MADFALGGQTVTVIARTYDTDGDHTEAVLVVVEGCSVQPSAAAEDVDGREQATNRFTVYGPVVLGVARSHHQLEVPGWVVGVTAPTGRLDMAGNAVTWPDETGAAHHVEAPAVRTTG